MSKLISCPHCGSVFNRERPVSFMSQVVAALPPVGATAKELMPLFDGKTRRQIDRALQLACCQGLAVRLFSGTGRGKHTVYAPSCSGAARTKPPRAVSVFDYAQKLGALN